MSGDRYRVISVLERDPRGEVDHEKIKAFAKANGLDAGKIPAFGSFRIVGDVIRYREFADERLDPRTLTGWKTVPLVSTPDEHGVATHEVVVVEILADRLVAAGMSREQAEELAPLVQEIVADEVSR